MSGDHAGGGVNWPDTPQHVEIGIQVEILRSWIGWCDLLGHSAGTKNNDGVGELIQLPFHKWYRGHDREGISYVFNNHMEPLFSKQKASTMNGN